LVVLVFKFWNYPDICGEMAWNSRFRTR
jgi:hypothetical protein